MKGNDFWSIFGKISMCLVVVAGILQILTFFKNDYKVVATGQYYKHEVSINEIIDLIKKLPFDSEDSLIQKITEDLSSDNRYRYMIYPGMWIFTIENKGKNLEGVTLKFFADFFREGLSEGYYQIETSDSEIIRYGTFDRSIDIGNIKPANKFVIKCWSYVDSKFVNDYDLCQKHTFFTHSNEARVPIVYPINVSNSYVLNKRLYNIPLIIGFVAVSFLFYYGNTFRIRERLKSLSKERKNNEATTRRMKKN
jgi:hypothetical protein